MVMEPHRAVARIGLDSGMFAAGSPERGGALC